MLLADEVVKNGCAEVDIGPIVPRIREAQKFLLEPDAAHAAEALSANYSGLVRAFPFLRLPFHETWIEVAQLDRPQFMAAGIHIPVAQRRPHRVGFLCSATRNDLSAWRTHLFWSLRDPEYYGAASIAMDVDVVTPFTHADRAPTAEELQSSYDKTLFTRGVVHSHPGWTKASDEVKIMMINHTQQNIPDYGAPMPPPYFSNAQIAQFYHVAFQLARGDWAGEIAYLMAVIALLNTRNASERVPQDQTSHNKKRAKAGRLPLFSHHTVRIHERLRERVYGTAQSNGNHAPMRYHLVMGHWKVRRTGVFFWNPFTRGSAEVGAVEKDYVL